MKGDKVEKLIKIKELLIEMYGTECSSEDSKNLMTVIVRVLKMLEDKDDDYLDDVIKTLTNDIRFLSKLKMSGVKIKMQLSTELDRGRNGYYPVAYIKSIEAPEDMTVNINCKSIDNGRVMISPLIWDIKIYKKNKCNVKIDIRDLNLDILAIQRMEHIVAMMIEQINVCTGDSGTIYSIDNERQIIYDTMTLDKIISAMSKELMFLINIDNLSFSEWSSSMVALKELLILKMIDTGKNKVCVPSGIVNRLDMIHSTADDFWSKKVNIGVSLRNLRRNRTEDKLLNGAMEQMIDILSNPIIKVTVVEPNLEVSEFSQRFMSSLNEMCDYMKEIRKVT
jgi:hypothetical protein